MSEMIEKVYFVVWSDEHGPVETGPFWDRAEADERAELFGGTVEAR